MNGPILYSPFINLYKKFGLYNKQQKTKRETKHLKEDVSKS